MDTCADRKSSEATSFRPNVRSKRLLGKAASSRLVTTLHSLEHSSEDKIIF
jgi:hypothetical protein